MSLIYASFKLTKTIIKSSTIQKWSNKNKQTSTKQQNLKMLAEENTWRLTLKSVLFTCSKMRAGVRDCKTDKQSWYVHAVYLLNQQPWLSLLSPPPPPTETILGSQDQIHILLHNILIHILLHNKPTPHHQVNFFMFVFDLLKLKLWHCLQETVTVSLHAVLITGASAPSGYSVQIKK